VQRIHGSVAVSLTVEYQFCFSFLNCSQNLSAVEVDRKISQLKQQLSRRALELQTLQSKWLTMSYIAFDVHRLFSEGSHSGAAVIKIGWCCVHSVLTCWEFVVCLFGWSAAQMTSWLCATAVCYGCINLKMWKVSEGLQPHQCTMLSRRVRVGLLSLDLPWAGEEWSILWILNHFYDVRFRLPSDGVFANCMSIDYGVHRTTVQRMLSSFKCRASCRQARIMQFNLNVLPHLTSWRTYWRTNHEARSRGLQNVEWRHFAAVFVTAVMMQTQCVRWLCLHVGLQLERMT
jgi:hypothetical protein